MGVGTPAQTLRPCQAVMAGACELGFWQRMREQDVSRDGGKWSGVGGRKSSLQGWYPRHCPVAHIPCCEWGLKSWSCLEPHCGWCILGHSADGCVGDRGVVIASMDEWTIGQLGSKCVVCSWVWAAQVCMVQVLAPGASLFL